MYNPPRGWDEMWMNFYKVRASRHKQQGKPDHREDSDVDAQETQAENSDWHPWHDHENGLWKRWRIVDGNTENQHGEGGYWVDD